MLLSLIKKTPFQLLVLIILVQLWGHLLPFNVIQASYTISILLKDCLLWGLPLAIVSFIATTLQSFQKKAAFFVLFLMIFEAFSNASSVLFAYGVGTTFEDILTTPRVSLPSQLALEPLFSIAGYRPSFWGADKAVFLGIILGLGACYKESKGLSKALLWLKEISVHLFLRIFVRLIPVYVLGFLLHMNYTGVLSHIIEHYSLILLFLGLSLGVYLLFLLILSADFKVTRFKQLVSTIWPTGMIAFSSMSSAATMPFTIAAAEKNLKNPALAGMIIPATTNIQQVGDCLANALLCLVILKTFGLEIPDCMTWLAFTFVFILARFTTVGMLGGAIFIMIPIYERYLGFTPEMSSLMIALNVVLDPIITAANVMANGALCILIEKIWGVMTVKKAIIPLEQD